jgi:hypothetical protein
MYLLGTSFPTFTPTASSAQTTQPVTNLALSLALRPFVLWRATSAESDQWVRLALGVQMVLDGVFLNNLNVSSVIVERSTDGSTFTSMGTFAVPVDRRVNRRKAYLRLAGFNYSYLRITFPAANYVSTPQAGWVSSGDEWDVGGPGAIECGVILPVASVLTLDDHAPVWPRDYIRQEAHDVIGFASGGIEVIQEGSPYLELPLRLQGIRATATAQVDALSALTIGQPFLLAEDFGHPEYAYLVRRVEDDAIMEDAGIVEREHFLAREAV